MAYTTASNPLHSPRQLNEQAAVDLLMRAGPSYPEQTVRAMVRALNTYTKDFGDDAINVLAQMALETDWFRFSGDVQPEQFNFAGLGATGNGARGASFKTPTDGILAVLIHRATYFRGLTSTWPVAAQAYAHADLMPRYSAAIAAGYAGKATNVQYLAGRWAKDPDYADKMVGITNDLEYLAMTAVSTPPARIFTLPMRLTVSHIPWSNPNRTRLTSLPSGRGWITIHETGNPNEGADAEMHRVFTHRGGGPSTVSFNYVIDDTEVIELVPRGERTWQASDGAEGPGNSSVSIELCVNRDGNFTKAMSNLAHFLVWLVLNDSNLSLDRVAQHWTWARDRKNCPTTLRANNNRLFNALMQEARRILQQFQDTPIPEVRPTYLHINNFYLIEEILDEYLDLGDRALPLLGYPKSGMFLAPIDQIPRKVQIFERGALAIYAQGTVDGVPADHPFHVRNLFPHERAAVLEYGKANGNVGQDVV